MVCIRCQMVVKSKLEKLGLQYSYVKIGEADIVGDLDPPLLEALKIELEEAGLFIIDNKKAVIVERIKNILIELVHYNDEELNVKLSDYLSDKLNYDYTYLANVFSKRRVYLLKNFI